MRVLTVVSDARKDHFVKKQSSIPISIAFSPANMPRRSFHVTRIIVDLLLLVVYFPTTTVECTGKIVVVGSVNADTFLAVKRLPVEGENLLILPGRQPLVDVPGGKGCTQAVAAAKLYLGGAVSFVGQFGNDAAAEMLQAALREAQVDVSHSARHTNLPSGRGYVFLAEASGKVSAVVSGGSNQEGWKDWERAWEAYAATGRPDPNSNVDFDAILQDCHCLLLQREVPEFVNKLIARLAKDKLGDQVTIIQDVGGEDRPMDEEMLACCDYIMPNESELVRLVQSFGGADKTVTIGDTDDLDDETIIRMAKVLQQHGARNVLVTRGSRGCLVVSETGDILPQPAMAIAACVDETGAGDCFRAAFAVALIEGQSLPACLEFACAAGACSVERTGAVPSTPSRDEVQAKYQHYIDSLEESVLKIPRGDGVKFPGRGGANHRRKDDDFPFLIGSRLNSMKDRPELWGVPVVDPRDFVKRQGTVAGLTCVDFNYPQHFLTWSTEEAKAALEAEGLVAGAVCLRFPSKFARGAMNHPDAEMRRESINLTKEAARVALDLGCNEVVVWSAYDGYDYPFQVDYDTKWAELVEAFREVCDDFPTVKFSLEFKPTDENTRFFTVPSTGAALLLVNEVHRKNFGLTLDVGHMLMSGENPGQSIAMVGRAGKLFGIQLNDGYTRLAAEDGLMFGSVHPPMALEIMYQLKRIGFDGHLYFDTFPQRTDPVREAEYNIQQVKAFWKAAGAIDKTRLHKIAKEHDAIEALQMMNDAIRNM